MLAFACSFCGKDQELSQTLGDGKAPCRYCGQFVSIPQTHAMGNAGHATLAFDAPGGPRPPESSAPADIYDFLAPPRGPGEMGRLGSYKVVKVLGAGGMGVVFQAEDLDLQRPVALKCLLPTLAATSQARQRFLREARAAAGIEHDNIVVIYRVGEDRGIPYLAMQLLQGEALEDRLRRDGQLPVAEVLRIGREIALGLAAAHARGLIHRDVKPGNIWLDGTQARVKLLDFGLARAVAEDTQVTQQGTIVGTPAYMAPEQASGQPVDGRCDLFSLGCVMYQMATGQLPFQGTNTISLLLAVANLQPGPPSALNKDLPPVLSDLVLHLLAKNPAERPPSAEAVVEIITAIQEQLPPPTQGMQTKTGLAAAPGTRSWQAAKTGFGGAALPPGTLAGPIPEPEPRQRRRWPLLAGLVAAVLLLAGAAFIVPPLFNRPAEQQPADNTRTEGLTPAAAKGVEIGVAYGSEKKNWLTSAVKQFNQTAEGKDIVINLIPKGSIEGAQSIWKDEDKRIHVWAPASSLFRDTLVQHWQKKHPRSPILKEESLALTPLVFVLWEDRYQALLKKYGSVSFATIGKAMEQEGGWGAIAGKPEWGQVKFSHTDAAKSNSGLMTLVLMAYEFHHKTSRLAVADVTDPAFQAWVHNFEKGIPRTSNSTGALMEDMVKFGPASLDALFVYESLVIDYFKQARGRWGNLRVVYPAQTLWSDSPYCILDVPWSGPAERQAAEVFLRFLLSEPMQREALTHGFRPADLNIPINAAGSPFLLLKDSGLQTELKTVVQPPGDEVIEQLLQVWSKARS